MVSSRRLRTVVALPVVLAMLASGMILPGCATRQPGDGSGLDDYKPIFRLAVSIGVDRLLTANPQLTTIFVSVSKVLEDVFNKGEFTSVAQLSSFLHARIPWDKISAETRPFVEALITAIADELKVLATRYQIPESQELLLAREVMTWVREVAERHMAQPVRVQRVAYAH
jgi:hypothetical protein